MSRLALAAILALTIAAPPVLAQDEEAVWNNIESIHGNADGFFELLSLLQDAVMFGDPVTFAQYAFYPLAVNDSDGNYEIADEEEFLDSFDTVATEETLQAVLNQDVDDLIVTSEGVGVGNGAMWITNVCLDDSCEETQWGILSINN